MQSLANSPLLGSNEEKKKEVYFGYKGSISRDEAERKLSGKAMGTFLVRYSERANSFVISFNNKDGGVSHMADIFREEDGVGIYVKTENGKKQFENLASLLDVMIKDKDVLMPIGESE